MQHLVSNSLYFSQTSCLASSRGSNPHCWMDAFTCLNVLQEVRSVLGDNFPLSGVEQLVVDRFTETELQIYETLTHLLPFTPRSRFFWERVGRPFASMLNTARYPLESQCRFLIFVYARVLGFLGPVEEGSTRSVMTSDGGPVEFSWVIPNRKQPAIGEVTRQIRFAIEPMDPMRCGRPIRGSHVLDYYTSEEGSLGMVKSGHRGMDWRRSLEAFLFPDETSSIDVPEGSRYFVGFDFLPNGTLSLKSYYLPYFPPSCLSNRIPFLHKYVSHQGGSLPMFSGETDFNLLRPLIKVLHPSLARPFNRMVEYFDLLEESHKPGFQFLAVDCGESKANRLKIYFRTMNGLSISGVKRTFTMGGRIASPVLAASLLRLEALWGYLFKTPELSKTPFAPLRPGRPHPEHPNEGLLYYYEILPGQDEIFPKVYLPVSLYCENDLQIARAIEAFYSDPLVGVAGPPGEEEAQGWVSREVSKAFPHRPLRCKAGIHTYVTFGAKPTGWELTSYFSPEVWDLGQSN